jgi:hypothetical protein
LGRIPTTGIFGFLQRGVFVQETAAAQGVSRRTAAHQETMFAAITKPLWGLGDSEKKAQERRLRAVALVATASVKALCARLPMSAGGGGRIARAALWAAAQLFG